MDETLEKEFLVSTMGIFHHLRSSCYLYVQSDNWTVDLSKKFGCFIYFYNELSLIFYKFLVDLKRFKLINIELILRLN